METSNGDDRPQAGQTGDEAQGRPLLSIEELLAGKAVDMPAAGQQAVTFKKAPKRRSKQAQQLGFEE